MKSMGTVVTSAILFFIISSSNTQAADVPVLGELTEKEKLMLELRTLKRLRVDDREPINEKPKNNIVSHKINNVEHPEFGINDFEIGINALYPPTPPPKIDRTTIAAIKKTNKWLNKTDSPVVQKGKLVHPFGEGVPILVLKPLALSNIVLAADETIVPQGIHIGDQNRWGVVETYIGSGDKKRPNLIIKSLSTDEIKTILIILTTKRVYHIKLIATSGQWMPQLSFSYPETNVIRSPETIARLIEDENQRQEKKSNKKNDSYLYAAGDVEFNYSIKGDTNIMPTRVFNLGHQTVIEMPKSITSVNVPALLLEDSEGNPEMVNYNYVNNRYIVNQPIHTAYLISGVGWDEQKITVKKLENKQ